MPVSVRRARSDPAGLQPLPPDRKWRAITLASLLLAPALWAVLAGLVAAASEEPGGPQPAAAIALGLAVLPFTFIVLAFASEHPRAPGAVAKAMGWCLLIAIPVSAVAVDLVTGLVAGVGAGGIVALRDDHPYHRRARVAAVAVAAIYVFVLARVAGAVVLLAAPVFPFTSVGLADHLADWLRARSAEPSHPTRDDEG